MGSVSTLLELVGTPGQSIAYMFPEITSYGGFNSSVSERGLPAGLKEVFVFQFWPQQITDSYSPNYATKQIPGASHPLYQWTGGSGRTISFTAQFVTEIREDAASVQNFGTDTDFRSRLNTAGKIASAGTAITAALLPSTRYKVNVAGAIAALQQYLYPNYGYGRSGDGIVRPPRKLYLVLPGTKLGRWGDGFFCIMKAANVTIESWFPSGEIRSASVALEFAEIVQHTQGRGSKILYISSQHYRAGGLAQTYEVASLANPSTVKF